MKKNKQEAPVQDEKDPQVHVIMEPPKQKTQTETVTITKETKEVKETRTTKEESRDTKEKRDTAGKGSERGAQKEERIEKRGVASLTIAVVAIIFLLAVIAASLYLLFAFALDDFKKKTDDQAVSAEYCEVISAPEALSGELGEPFFPYHG